MNTIVVSFYTNDWEYPQYAEKLKKDCERVGVSHHIRELKSTGDYIRNTALKPSFILSMLKELKTPILWIDCDGSLLSLPLLVDEPTDADFRAKRTPKTSVRTWHVGTLWINYTEKAIKLLENWVQQATTRADDSAFEAAVKHVTDAKGEELPPGYFHILKNLKDTAPPGTVVAHRLSKSPSKVERRSRR